MFELFTEKSPSCCLLRGWIKHTKEINNEWNKFFFYYLCDDTVYQVFLAMICFRNLFQITKYWIPRTFILHHFVKDIFKIAKYDLRKLKMLYIFSHFANFVTSDKTWIYDITKLDIIHVSLVVFPICTKIIYFSALDQNVWFERKEHSLPSSLLYQWDVWKIFSTRKPLDTDP